MILDVVCEVLRICERLWDRIHRLIYMVLHYALFPQKGRTEFLSDLERLIGDVCLDTVTIGIFFQNSLQILGCDRYILIDLDCLPLLRYDFHYSTHFG